LCRTRASIKYADIEKVISGNKPHLALGYESIFTLRTEGKGKELRAAYKDLWASLLVGADADRRSGILGGIKDAQAKMDSELEEKGGSACQTFKFLIPDHGFTHQNVQRLLIAHGIENHLNCVPMAIFFSLEPNL
jgi:hypothetical protein